ncbi:MAG: sulfatase-like hydrolase/transferase [Planctomycetes bacterium]|nr:sulfatase-like hydrolase/transferase [Planctomycetota bacterium]
MTPLPARVRLGAALAAVQLAGLAAFRAGFWALFHGRPAGAQASEVARALGVGLRFDLRLALLLALPLVAASWVPWLDPARGSRARRLLVGLAVLAALPVYLMMAVDLGHYGWLGRRLDATVVEHLEAPAIAWEALRESYPVGRILVGLAAVLALHGMALVWLLPRRRGGGGRGRVPGTLALALALVAAGIYGKASWYPLRWSDAFWSPDPFLTALGLNPVLHLVDTWPNRARTADRALLGRLYPELATWLGVERPDPERLEFERRVPARRAPAGPRPNVVFVHLESLAAFKVGCLGNRAAGTPRLDELAAEGWLYRNFFVATSPTARSVYSVVTGIPDLNPRGSATRNPLAVDRPSVASAFEGYARHYLLGGSASWGNLRALLTRSVEGIQIHEEGSYGSPRNDVWGISDLDLFGEALRVFDAEGERPFLAWVQTAGNHRPWTIPGPARSAGFRPTALPDEFLRGEGFDEGRSELDALRLLDHAVGEFFRQARTRPWFGRTVFFLYGDHGTTAPASHPWHPLGLDRNHVPLVVHAPWLLGAPRVEPSVASSLDLLPTAAGLAGLAYTNQGFGRDLLAERPPGTGEPYAFIRAVPYLGLVGDERFLRLDPDGAVRLYRHRSEAPTEDVAHREPDRAARMERLCRALAEAARWTLEGGAP